MLNSAKPQQAGGRVAAPAMPRPSRLLPLAILLVPLVMLAGGGWLSWRAVWADARAGLAQSSGAAAQYAARALEGYLLGAGRVNDHLRGLDDAAIRAEEPRLAGEVQRVIADLPQVNRASVIDRRGIPLIATNLVPVPQSSLGDRDYFVALGAAGPPAVFVSPAFHGRFDGHLVFSLARRRADTGNDSRVDGFDGVVLLSVEPGMAVEAMRLLQHGPADRLAVVSPRGRVVLDSGRAPRPDEPPLLDMATPGMALNGARLFETRLSDGAAMLVAIRPVEGFGVAAAAMRPRTEIIRAWRDGMAGHLIFGVPATLMLLWLSLRLRQDQRRLDTLAAELATDVERGADRLNLVRRFGLVGTFEHDLRTGRSRRSPAYMALQGMEAASAEERHADWVQRLHPDDRDRAERHLLETLSVASGASVYGQTYRTIDADGEVRWIAACGEIERDGEGRAVVLRGAHVDVTPLRTTELALAESDARLRLAQETAGIGTFEWHPAQRRLGWSRTMLELWGFDPAQGQPSMEAANARVHPEDLPGLRRQLAAAARDGRLRAEFRLQRPNADGAVETVWVAARGRRLEGGKDQVLGVAYDITERKRADQQNRLLSHEVEHRAKNVLAVVSGLLRVTTAASIEAYVEALEGRVSALARTLSLLGEKRWVGAGLRELLEHELAPFDDGAGRVTLDGPPVSLPADIAQPMSMALHELATNAAKYGALSAAGGRLSVRWTLTREEGAGEEGVLWWDEQGGPTIHHPPDKEGFGSALIQQGFGDLDGQVILDWRREGLLCTMRFTALPTHK